jgi:eukaryotic-like serine/threonine-protein kinase
MAIGPNSLQTGGALRGALATSLTATTNLRELQPGEVIGAFRIVCEHSRGGMAIVYRAERASGEFQQRVALKWMQPRAWDAAAARLFEREREYVAALEHPQIARLIDGGREADGALWFALEWIDGLPIDAYCEQRQLALTERVWLVITLCQPLGFAHSRMLLHRDIKPANILITHDSQLKLLDFGVAQVLGQDDALVARALTPAFASPEQRRGDSLGVTSDVYQVGLLLDHLTVNSAKTGGPELRAIIACATAQAPALRYQTVSDLRADLERWLARRPLAAMPNRVGYRLQCLLRRHPWSSAGTLLAATALAALGVGLVRQNALTEQQAIRAIAQAERANAALRFVTDMTQWAKPSVGQGREVSISEALGSAVSDLEGALSGQPQLKGELQYIFGEIYLKRRERSKARPLLEAAYQALRESADTDPALLAQCETYLGMVINEAPERARSIALLSAAIERYRRHQLPLDAHYISAQQTKATRLLQIGELAPSLTLAQAAIPDAITVFGEESLEVQVLRAHVAEVLVVSGQLADSLPVYQAAFANVVKHYGPEHPSNASGALILARLLTDAGHYAEAEALLTEQALWRPKIWGARHPEFARFLSARGYFFYRRDDPSQDDRGSARRDALAAISGCCADPLQGKRYLGEFYALLGMIEARAGAHTAAVAAFRSALDPALVAVAVSPNFGDVQLRLARALRQHGDARGAREALDAAALEMRPLPASHPRWRELAAEQASVRPSG